MGVSKVKAVGSVGSWFAKVDGELFPCVHKYWVSGLHHHARRAWQHDPKHIELVAAIRAGGLVVLTKDEVTGDGEAFSRTGYIALYRVENVQWHDDELEFDLVEKLATL